MTPLAQGSLDQPQRRSSRVLSRPVFWLGLLLLVSGALGVWHADWRLDSGRRWDERFSLRNANALLSGRATPENAYYPSLSFLPATAAFWAVNGVARAAGYETPIRIHANHATPTTYLVARLLSVCFILAALLLTFRVGVLCCDAWTGLMAAVLLAFSPQVIDKSAVLKPDALLLATTLAAVWLALRALAVPSLRRFLIAGVAIGIAMSAKYNGGPVAFSLVVVAALVGGRERRAWKWLAMAAVVAAAVFLLLNPWVLTDPRIYRRAFDFQVAHYARMGELRSGGSHLAQLLFLPQWVASSMALSLVPALLGFAGVVLWIVLGWRTRLRGTSRRFAVIFGFLLAYTVLYVVSSTNPVGRNWLPLLPYIALAAAWVARGAWKIGADRWPLLGRAWLWLPIAMTAGALWFVQGAGYVYRLHVPTTAEAATSWVLAQVAPPEGRMMVTEVAPGWDVLADQGKGMGVIEHDPLSALPAAVVARSDAVLVRASSLEGPRASIDQGAIGAMPGARRSRFAAAAFERRGPAIIAVAAGWRRIGVTSAQMAPGPSTREWGWNLPPALAGGTISLAIGVRSEQRINDLNAIRVRIGGGALRCAVGRRGDQRLAIVTSRVRVGADERLTLRLPAGEPGARRVVVQVYRWRPPGPPGNDDASSP